MPNLKLMRITCIVYNKHNYDVLLMLRKYGALNVTSDPIIEKMSAPQSAKMTVVDVIRDKMTVEQIVAKTGLSKSGAYAGLTQAAKAGLIRRVGKGVYAPAGQPRVKKGKRDK